MEQKFEISKELAEKIMQYLAQRPYLESFQLIDALRSLNPVAETPVEVITEAE